MMFQLNGKKRKSSEQTWSTELAQLDNFGQINIHVILNKLGPTEQEWSESTGQKFSKVNIRGVKL
jgi:hypothetical protein